MHLEIRSLSIRRFLRCAVAAAWLVGPALTGCNQVDPLEAVRQQQEDGDFEGSVEALRKLLATRPDDPEVNYLYGRALSNTQPHLAVWSLRKAMEDPEWLVPAGSQLAFLALAGLDFNEVYKITGRILERDPDNVQVLLMRANAYAHSKQNPELAIADAKRILEINPDAIEAYEPMILGLLGQEKLEEASKALAEAGRRLVELGRDEGVQAWHCATTAAFQEAAGDLEKVRKTWGECLEAYPTDQDVVSSAMKFYDAQQEPDRSLEIVRAAVAGGPSSRFFRATLAQRLVAKGDSAEAEAVLQEATAAKDPEAAAAAWMDLGKFRQALGEYAAGADAVERAVELVRASGSATPQTLFEYADALVLADRLDRALEVAEELPVPAHGHLIRGRVAQKRRDPARALAEFDQALDLWPDNPWARYYTALAAEELGDFERALEEYRNSVRIEPGATDARTRGAALLLAQGNPSGASIMLQAGISDAPLEIEGMLLGMRLSGLQGNTTGVSEFLAMVEDKHPARVGQALAEAAEGLTRRNGPAVALSMLTTAPGLDLNQPRYAAALRAIVRFAHQAGQTDAMHATLAKILATDPDSSAFQDIRGLDLELSGAPAEAVRAAYQRSLQLVPENPHALAGLGRLAASKDPEAALGFFDRAAAADPLDPALKLAAARALIASGKISEAEQRLDALLLEHPYEAEAAAERARLDLEQGVATAQTLERARRAVRFGGGPDALELLSRVHAKRNEPELAARAIEAARVQREEKASEVKP